MKEIVGGGIVETLQAEKLFECSINIIMKMWTIQIYLPNLKLLKTSAWSPLMKLLPLTGTVMWLSISRVSGN